MTILPRTQHILNKDAEANKKESGKNTVTLS
jgi:hypothetical protein